MKKSWMTRKTLRGYVLWIVSAAVLETKNYKELVNEVIMLYEVLEYNKSLKMHMPVFYMDFIPANLDALSWGASAGHFLNRIALWMKMGYRNASKFMLET